MGSLYNMIFKRKSFHVFKNLDHLTQEKLQEIENHFKQLQPLKDDIQVHFKITRFTPSACNTQPWFVESEGDHLTVYRVKGKRGMMPADKVVYYNRIDMGIFLLFIELCLKQEYTAYNRRLLPDTLNEKAQVLTAKYTTNHS